MLLISPSSWIPFYANLKFSSRSIESDQHISWAYECSLKFSGLKSQHNITYINKILDKIVIGDALKPN